MSPAPASSRAPERRTDPRTAVEAVLLVSVGTEERAVRVEDLSCGGALVRADQEPLPPGMRTVVLRVAGRSLELTARVAWTRDGRQGLRFVGLSDVDRLALAEHVDRRSAPGRRTRRKRERG
jgi:hypothetical protein